MKTDKPNTTEDPKPIGGGDSVTMTNQAGVAEIVPDVATALLIDLKQYSMELSGIAYNTTTSPVITTLILDTIIPHL